LLSLTNGKSIADIGAGSGFFAVPFARAIEPDGWLFAVDLQPEMLDFLRAKLRDSAAITAKSRTHRWRGNCHQLKGRQLRSRLPWKRLA
jgi:ubiquinone/menaquinone biosynthesis C-methylase UbiE